MRKFLFASLICLPGAAFAVGGGNDDPPKPTDTTVTCEEGMVFSEKHGKCVAPTSGALDDEELYRAVRELAYAGRFEETLNALDAMSDQGDDRVLTYRGFVHRSQGDVALGNAYYRKALAANPDNLLARSYMGQGFVAEGRIDLARAELTEIRARGGRGTWAETALMLAIETGRLSAY